MVAEDAGRLINPMIVDGQIHGGVAQGIANALLEEIVYDETGNILTATLADYLPPTSHEIPPIEIHHLETLTEASITKAKGLGEGGAIGAPAAIVNAINDALSPFGVSIDEMPVTPQRIRTALQAQARRRSATHEPKRPTSRSPINGREHIDPGRAAPHARRRHPRRLRPDRHPYRLRARRVRRLHGASSTASRCAPA